MVKWQTIETAPKDGTRILLWGTCHADGASRFDTQPMAVAGIYSDGWETDPADYYTVEVRPSHWMPIPKPPLKD